MVKGHTNIKEHTAMDYMESKLLSTIKRRLFDELTDTLQKHANYRDKVKVFHKFPYKERPMMGVVLKNASGSRQRLSADDYAAEMSSHLALAAAKNKEGRVLKWVWEDQVNLVKFQKDEDLSSQLSGDTVNGTNRVFKVSKKPMVAGPFNTEIADNFGQVEITIDGNKTFAEYVNGSKGIVILEQAPPMGSVVLISYFYNNLTPPGRYYIEIVSPTQFVIDPIYVVKDEELITRTSGTELTAQTEFQNLLPDFDVLYTMKTRFSNKIPLERGVDYTITVDGVITFINPLPVSVTLYATYRWIGDELGPFNLPEGDFEYNNTALPGVIMSFGSERILGDKNVIIVYPKRETAAKVYSGHWTMTFDIDVVSRDTEQLPELTDHIINDLWSYKRLKLIMEGITMESLDPSGEVEDVYDENTGDQFYKHVLSLTLLTEWKKFEPFLTEIMDYDISLYPFVKTVDYVINKQGKILELHVVPNTKPFEVKYPEVGFVRYY
jgi:hypothetical protein